MRRWCRAGGHPDALPSRRLQALPTTRHRSWLVPDLVRGQTEVGEHRPERLPAVDRIEELLAHLGGESLLRRAAEAGLGGVVLRLTTLGAVAAFQPSGQGAVGHLRATAAALGIGLVADVV